MIAGLFPVRWNLYHQSGHINSTEYSLGSEKRQPLLSIELGGYWSFKTGITLRPYGTPNTSNEILVEIKGATALGRQATIRVPSEGYESAFRCDWNLKKSTFSFEVLLPNGDEKGGQAVERFEWRCSRGKEVKALGKVVWGWKLVRDSSSSSSNPVISGAVGSSSRVERQPGITSDRKEIVAVCAENESLSWSK